MGEICIRDTRAYDTQNTGRQLITHDVSLHWSISREGNRPKQAKANTTVPEQLLKKYLTN